MDKRYRVIYYYENFNKALNHYVGVLEKIKKQFSFTYWRHYLPHDVKKCEFVSGACLIIESYRTLLSEPIETVPRIRYKLDAIEMV